MATLSDINFKIHYSVWRAHVLNNVLCACRVRVGHMSAQDTCPGIYQTIYTVVYLLYYNL